MSLLSSAKTDLGIFTTNPRVLSSALLSERFEVSVQTIRKDMNDLSDKGMVRRVHGGISLPSPNDNLSFSNRDLINLSANSESRRGWRKNYRKDAVFSGYRDNPKQVAQALLDHPA